jgi:hypothetical protein
MALLHPGPHSFGCTPSSGITASPDRSSITFLRKFYTAFHRGCTYLFSHQQWIFPKSSPKFILFVFLIIAILTGVKWKFQGNFVLNFLCGKGSWAFPQVFFCHLYYFFWKLVSSFAHFFIVSLIIQDFSFLSSL